MKQSFSFLRRVWPVALVAIVIAVGTTSCNANNKKYGCPNHLKVVSPIK